MKNITFLLCLLCSVYTISGVETPNDDSKKEVSEIPREIDSLQTLCLKKGAEYPQHMYSFFKNKHKNTLSESLYPIWFNYCMDSMAKDPLACAKNNNNNKRSQKFIRRQWFIDVNKGMWLIKADMHNAVLISKIPCYGLAQVELNKGQSLIKITDPDRTKTFLNRVRNVFGPEKSEREDAMIHDFSGAEMGTPLSLAAKNIHFIPETDVIDNRWFVFMLQGVGEKYSHLNPISARLTNDKKLIINHKERDDNKSQILIYNVSTCGHFSEYLQSRNASLELIGLCEALRRAYKQDSKLAVTPDEYNIIEKLPQEFKGTKEFLMEYMVLKEDEKKEEEK
jgi:hypothetical protein